MRKALPFSIASVLGTLAMLTTFVGCADKGPVVGGSNAPNHISGGTVISLSPSTTELVNTVTPTMRLIGRTKSDNWPVMVEKVPVVCDVKPNYEAISAAHPNLILYDAALFSEADIAKLKSSAQVIVAIKGESLEEFTDSIYEVGRATENETPASEYADKIYNARTSASSDLFPAKPKVAILLGNPTTGMYIAGLNSFQADVMKAAGVEPVGPPSKLFEPMNAEALVQWNPDVIVLGSSKDSVDKVVNGLLSDPRFKSLQAIQSKRIVALDEDIVTRRGARVDKFIELLHKQIKARLN